MYCKAKASLYLPTPCSKRQKYLFAVVLKSLVFTLAAVACGTVKIPNPVLFLSALGRRMAALHSTHSITRHDVTNERKMKREALSSLPPGALGVLQKRFNFARTLRRPVFYRGDVDSMLHARACDDRQLSQSCSLSLCLAQALAHTHLREGLIKVLGGILVWVVVGGRVHHATAFEIRASRAVRQTEFPPDAAGNSTG